MCKTNPQKVTMLLLIGLCAVTVLLACGEKCEEQENAAVLIVFGKNRNPIYSPLGGVSFGDTVNFKCEGDGEGTEMGVIGDRLIDQNSRLKFYFEDGKAHVETDVELLVVWTEDGEGMNIMRVPAGTHGVLSKNSEGPESGEGYPKPVEEIRSGVSGNVGQDKKDSNEPEESEE